MPFSKDRTAMFCRNETTVLSYPNVEYLSAISLNCALDPYIAMFRASGYKHTLRSNMICGNRRSRTISDRYLAVFTNLTSPPNVSSNRWTLCDLWTESR